ncbi:hypothetical protein [Flavobacterium sp. 245]|uniref:hypothetical protein n=1 Tax=Flavobacterium sp. 245 TaxID=2512115 RepID=UPI0010DCBC2B|nr:hypothetical protein [Flavobacterium sp. 245]TDO94895.1 hypothetical protein EV145_11619 [Flavobacterium sp. 245]
MFKIKYNFEFFCFPIWIKETNNNMDPIFRNISIDDLPVSNDLKAQIKNLDASYQSTYNDEYPPEPLKMSLEDENVFCKEVINSALKLKESLPDNYQLLFDSSYWQNRINENIEMSNINEIENKEKNIFFNETKIKYEIISRGEMIVKYNDKSVQITGELIFDPPTFYADLVALKTWNAPNYDEITEEEKAFIINYLTSNSINEIKTKIIFD